MSRIRRLSGALTLAFGLGLPFAAPADAGRIAAAGGTLTEIVYALGLGEHLVGADTTSRHPQSAESLPKIGYLRSLGAEGVLSLRPDLLLAAAEAGPPTVIGQLRASGLRVVQVGAPNSPEGVEQKIRAVAEATGSTGQGEKLIAQFRVDWQRAVEAIAVFADRPRVLFILAHTGGSPMVAGRGTSADAMIRLAGAVNAAAAFDGFKPMTAEAVLAADPQVLLITTEGVETLGGLDRVWDHPSLRLTSAGRHRRLVAMDALYLLGFGPRLPQAVAELSVSLRRSEGSP